MDIINKNKPVIEAIKEVVRLIVLALIAWAVTSLGSWDNEVAGVLILVLRALDKWVHQSDSNLNGLLPF